MNISLRVAAKSDLDRVLAYVGAYHQLEHVAHSAARAAASIRPLLGRSALGRVWLICLGSHSIGYVAICFGYSIEFSGRDAVVDELFIIPEHRGKGFGKTVFALVKAEAALLDVRALHLEVNRANERARRLYRSAGFVPRGRFVLMSARLDSVVGRG